MSQNTTLNVTEQQTNELRYLHKVMQAIQILGEQPSMNVVAYGKIWRYGDLLKTAVRYAELAELHGYDTSAFKHWFQRDIGLFQQYGIELKVS
ncbi:hypothetical protein ABGI61_08500 [Rheinheimera sp. FR7-31]|uniref:hypothetical protein n=1 Tax=Rheinheimera fenheensis TaxID=3152295 RepID=UPI00325EC7E9